MTRSAVSTVEPAVYPRYFDERAETMSPAALRELQSAKLRRQIAYVWERSPFYRDRFQAAGLRPEHVRTIDDLRLLPFVTKDDVRQSQEAAPPLGLHACVPMEQVIRVNATSGTTGRPTYMGITEHDRQVWLEIVCRCVWGPGIRPNDVMVDGLGLRLFAGGLAIQQAVERIGATFVPTNGETARLLHCMQDLRATAIRASPSYMLYLTEYVTAKLGRDPGDYGLRKIWGGAEPGYNIPAIRRKIEQAWGAVVGECMGNSDLCPNLFGECEVHHGMHFGAGEFVAMELVDPVTSEPMPIEDGVCGEVVYTAIDRECGPLLRYRSRDLLLVRTEPCPCGRTGPRVWVQGRADDMLIVRGVNVFPTAIRDVVCEFAPRTSEVMQILLEQPGPRVEPPLRIVVEHGPEPGDPAQLGQAIEEILRLRLSCRAAVELVPPMTLPRFEYKAKLVRKLYEEKTS